MNKYYYFLLCISLLVLNACNKEKEDTTVVSNYLKDSRLSLDLTEPKSANPFITDSLVKAKDIFMVAESHAVACNPQTRLFFIKNLLQHTDTLCYFVELSFAACQLLNNYVQTGDETILQFLYDNYKGTFEYTKENFAFWQKFRAYSNSLAPPKKIIVVGLDVEHQSLNALRYIRVLLGNKPPPSNIDSIVTNLKNKATLNYRGLNDQNWLKQYNNLVTSNKFSFLSFLGEKYFDLEFTLNNMQQAADYVTNGTLGFRESKLWENFKKLYPSVPKAKWFGQWGSYHTLQRSSHSTLANYMNSNTESPVQQKLVTIFSFYENCSYMHQQTTLPVGFSNVETENPYSPLANSNFTLFKLDKADSPFRKELLWWGLDEKLLEGVTVNYFQYIYFIKGVEAMQPYK
jgi:hypothetical protein